MFNIKYRTSILTVCLVVRALTVSGQITFNHAYEIGFHTLLTNITEVNSGYLGGGFIYDTSGVSYKGYLAHFDEYGNLDQFNSLEDSSAYISIGQDANHFLNDSVIVLATLTFTDSVEYCKILWLNNESDTIFTRNYNSPYLGYGEETDWMRPTSLDVDPEQNIYVSCQLVWPGETSNDFVIMKLNAQGDSLWSYLVNEDGSEYCYDIQAMDDGVIVGAGSIQGQGPQTFFKLNQNGEQLWTFSIDLFDYDISVPREIIVEEDGIVVACEYSYDGLFYRLPLLLKTNFSGNHLWSVPLPGSQMQFQPCEHIVKCSDDGYLAAAWQYEENPDEPEINGDDNWNAWLIKVSQDGVLEWERFYHFVESVQDKHRVYDLKATSDGGYIFCGDAIDEDVETNGQVIQMGWLVKVDACGCLVPGCDVDCTIGVDETENDDRKYFIHGPNPANQYLNLYFFEGMPDGELGIYDMTGKHLNGFTPRNGKTTYMVDVGGYAPGTYIIKLTMKGQVIQTEKIVVE